MRGKEGCPLPGGAEACCLRDHADRSYGGGVWAAHVAAGDRAAGISHLLLPDHRGDRPHRKPRAIFSAAWHHGGDLRTDLRFRPLRRQKPLGAPECAVAAASGSRYGGGHGPGEAAGVEGSADRAMLFNCRCAAPELWGKRHSADGPVCPDPGFSRWKMDSGRRNGADQRDHAQRQYSDIRLIRIGPALRGLGHGPHRPLFRSEAHKEQSDLLGLLHLLPPASAGPVRTFPVHSLKRRFQKPSHVPAGLCCIFSRKKASGFRPKQ